MKIYSPDNIPLSYFYFGYKKAKHYVTRETTFCDYLDIYEFELDLHNNLKKLKEHLMTHTIQKALIYWYPKSMDEENSPRLRPKALFKFADQVVWATIILVIGEWFDTNRNLKKLLPLEEIDKRNALDWMIPHSYNNRLRRVHRYNKITNTYERELLHYNGSSLYESFQWSLRQLNTNIQTKISTLLKSNEEVFIGEVDIQEFYPTLNIKYVQNVIKLRFEQLRNAQIIDEDKCIKWSELLERLMSFEFDFPDIEKLDLELLKRYHQAIIHDSLRAETLKRKDYILNVKNKLKNSLPLDLIASGFLSNCVLTEMLDRLIINKIKTEKNSKEKAPNFDINSEIEVHYYRYTDDITIISNSKEHVMEYCKYIKKCLEEIELNISVQKSFPLEEQTLTNIIKNQLKINGIKENKVFIEYLKEKHFKAKLEPMVINKSKNIPNSTAVIEKFSQISDISLYTLDDEELENFLLEMLQILNANFDKNEIKDETKVTFASWRIKKGLKEALFRNINIDKYHFDLYLKKNLRKYPYKVQLFEIVLLSLLDKIIYQGKKEKNINSLSTFLLSINQLLDNKLISAYGPFIRTTLLKTFTNEWGKVPLNLRDELRNIIILAIENWYKNNSNIYWHEKYLIYYCFSICKIKFDPFLKIELYKNTPIYNSLHSIKTIYKLRISELKDLLKSEEFKNNNKLYDFLLEANKPVILYQLRQIFYQSLHFDRKKQEIIMSNSDRTWYVSIWKFIKRVEANNYNYLLKLWNEWVLVSPKHVPSEGFEIVKKKLKPTDENSQYNFEYYKHLSIFIDFIKQYFSTPKSFNEFYQWLSKTLNKYTKEGHFTIDFLYERIKNYSIILHQLIPTSDRYPKLPIDNKIISKLNDNSKIVLSEYVIPFQDWLFYINYLQKSEIRYLKPLSEYEIMYLFNKLLENDSEIEPISLLNKGYTIDNWKKFREYIASSNEAKILSIENVKISGFLSNLGGFPIVDENLNNINYKRSLVLLGMLTGNILTKNTFKLTYHFKWKTLQELFYVTGHPSTQIAKLLVNTLNIHNKFYGNIYELINEQILPYKKLGRVSFEDIEGYKNEVKRYLSKSESNLLKWKNSNYQLLELINIDVDLFDEDD